MSFLAALFSSLAWAAPAVEAEEHAASVGELIFPLVNFLIFLYLVKLLYEKGIPGFPAPKEFLRSRRQDILEAINEANEAKQRADALVHDYKNRLAKLAEELRAIREALRAEGEREKAKLLAEAKEIAERIKADTDFLAEQEVRLAGQTLVREIVDAARTAAEKLIQQNFTVQDQKRMVSEFLSEVGAAR